MSTLNVNNITKYTGGEVVVNDASEDVDFRVESNGDANMLVVDAGNNAVGIGVAAPSGKFEIEDGGTSHGNTLLKVTLDDQSSHYGLSVGNDTYNTADEKGLILQQANDGTGQILVNTVGGIYIDTTGAVTKPNQPAFLVAQTTGITAQTLADNAATTISFNAEIFDANADYDGTNTFTAPITGKYFFSIQVGLDAGSSSNTQFSAVGGQIVCSNRTFYPNSGGTVYTDSNDKGWASGSTLVDMDASDTCTIGLFVKRAGGTATTTTAQDGATTGLGTYWSGYLVC